MRPSRKRAIEAKLPFATCIFQRPHTYIFRRPLTCCANASWGHIDAAQVREPFQPYSLHQKQRRALTGGSPAYQEVIPEEQHEAVGKESGQTAHVERWNNTLRQRLSRFVRKSLSFSKSDRMHEICLRLFLHRYNLSHLP